MKNYASIKVVVLAAIVLVFTVFVLQNTEVVEITFLFWSLKVSRVLLLLGTLAVGILAGLLMVWEISRRGARKR